MRSYNSLLPHPTVGIHRQREELDRNAATSPYCFSPAVGTHRWREELDRNVQLQVLIASVPAVGTHRQRVELDSNAQLQVLIASALQLVLTDREKN